MKNRKTSLLISISIIIFLVINIIPVSANQNQTNISGLGIKEMLMPTPVLKIEYDESSLEPIKPKEETREVDITISYKIAGTLANLLSNLLNKNVQIELLIDDSPSWCTATLDETSFLCNISTEYQQVSSVLSIALDGNAPASKVDKVNITVKASAVTGPLGLLTWIPEGNSTFNIPITPAYFPLFVVEPEVSVKEITPLNVTNISFAIENLGNAKTQFQVEVEGVPEDWDIDYLSAFMIDSPIDSDENTNDYSIGIRPSKNFDNVTINVTFTASYFADSGTGSTISITKQITLLNDGSLKDEEEDAIDLTIIILLIVALLLILIIIFFFMKMR